jgi:hypothetical protein
MSSQGLALGGQPRAPMPKGSSGRARRSSRPPIPTQSPFKPRYEVEADEVHFIFTAPQTTFGVTLQLMEHKGRGTGR